MKLLFLSKRGDLLPLAVRVQEEGHSVRLYLQELPPSARGANLVDTTLSTLPLIKNHRPSPAMVTRVLEDGRPDLVVGEPGMGKLVDAFHEAGVSVWGACGWGDTLDLSPDYQANVRKSLGISYEGEPCGAWWDGEGFLYHHTIKRVVGMMNEDAGAQALSGVVVKMQSPRTQRFEYGVGRLERLLKKSHYRGPVVVGEDIQVGFRLSEFSAVSELLKGSVVEQLQGKHLAISYEVAATVRLSLPPFPYSASVEVLPLKVDKRAEKHLWMVGVDEGEVGGVDGEVGWATARGESMLQCRERVYRTIRGVRGQLGELQFRGDVVQR